MHGVLGVVLAQGKVCGHPAMRTQNAPQLFQADGCPQQAGGSRMRLLPETTRNQMHRQLEDRDGVSRQSC